MIINKESQYFRNLTIALALLGISIFYVIDAFGRYKVLDGAAVVVIVVFMFSALKKIYVGINIGAAKIEITYFQFGQRNKIVYKTSKVSSSIKKKVLYRGGECLVLVLKKDNMIVEIQESLFILEDEIERVHNTIERINSSI